MDSGIVLAAFGCWVLAAFGGVEVLADLLSFFSIWLAVVYAMMILNTQHPKAASTVDTFLEVSVAGVEI